MSKFMVALLTLAIQFAMYAGMMYFGLWALSSIGLIINVFPTN